MKQLIRIFLYFFISFLFAVQSAYSWDNDITHMDLSKFAAEFSVLRSCIDEDDINCSYLKNIGLANDLGEFFQWGKYEKDAEKWIEEGAKYEDKPTLRSFNHFHNPLKQWNQAGLDEKLVVSLKGKSSLLWSQDGSYQQSSAGEDWSWQKTREYYYRALTSKTGSERRVNFAKTFRGLGHQIHLIQDKTVPDHVRNDAHPEDSLLGKDRINGAMFFETWAKNNPVIVNSHAAHAGQYLPNVSLDITLENLVPITQFYDTNQYTIGNPSQYFASNQASSLTIGLAEYTNVNFFSGDTIFAAERYSTDHRHYFPYPRKSSTDLQAYIDETKPLFTQIAEDGIEDKGLYIKKIRDGEIINHFVRTSRWTGKIYKVLGEGSLFYRSLYRDEKCHEDYASKLIPRAVGYSTGLLNYFFRGDIDILPNDSATGFVIENNSNEDMNGTFEIWYDDGNRKNAWSGELSIVKKSKSTNISSALPAADKYILVFQGKMGNEDGAVVGKIIEKRKFLFLVNLDQQVLSFQIKPKNNQYELIPLSKDINIKTSSSSSQLIVQSHPDQNEHVVIKPYSAVMYKPQITGFGVRSGIGTQYVYRPQSFSKNSPYRLYTKAFYPINIYSYSDLEAVGRKSYTLSDDKTQMVSYGNSIWKKLHEPMTCSGNYQEEGRTCTEKDAYYMKYIDSTNKLVNGPTLGIDEFSIYEYYGIPDQKVIRNWTRHDFVATISNDKAIYKKSTPNYEWNYSYYGYSIGGDDNCCNISVVTQTDEMSNEVKLIIGGTSILSKTGEGMADNINTVWRYKRGYHSSCKDIKDYVSENTQYSIDVIDYDNLYNDENIIFFYKVQEQIDFQERHETKGPCIEMSESSYKETTLTTTYHLYYKNNAITNSMDLPFVETYHIENQDGTITEETRNGERVTGVSSQINDKNIVYTYIAERLNEGTGEWEFIKRIIGIINRADPRLAVGYRQEFEISEANASNILTDIYADYEYKDLAAIGVHVE